MTCTLDMLEESIAEIRGQEISKVDDTQVDLNITAFVPNDYIPDLEQKMSAYGGLASASSKVELMQITADLSDPLRSHPPRYGSNWCGCCS